MSNVRIRVLKNGPYEVRGDPRLTDKKGGVYIGQKDPLYLCRCGQSKNKPYCDGTHAYRIEIDYQFHYPKQNDILPAQANYIEDFITDFEYALNGPNFTDTSIGYPHYIDVLLFIDFFIMNEISRNINCIPACYIYICSP